MEAFATRGVRMKAARRHAFPPTRKAVVHEGDRDQCGEDSGRLSEAVGGTDSVTSHSAHGLVILQSVNERVSTGLTDLYSHIHRK